MRDIRKEKYEFGKVVKVDGDGGGVDVGVGREVLIGWEDLGKVKRLWGEGGDELLVRLRIDSEKEMLAGLGSEGMVDKM